MTPDPAEESDPLAPPRGLFVGCMVITVFWAAVCGGLFRILGHW
jgi:hypothetical protein